MTQKHAVDPTVMRPGGTVELTFKTGSVVRGRLVAGDGSSLMVTGCGIYARNRADAVFEDRTITAYEPPAPAWDRPEVFAVKDVNGAIWRRESGGTFRCEALNHVAHRWSAGDLERSSGPCVALAVYADGMQS